MSLRAKPILLIVLLLLAVPITVFIALNLALQTPRIQTRLRSEISSVLGRPASIRSLYITPFGALRIQEIRYATEGNSPLLSADTAVIYPDYRRLLRGELTIKGVELHHPVVNLSLNQAPTLIFPAPTPSTSDTQPKGLSSSVPLSPMKNEEETPSSPASPKNIPFQKPSRTIVNDFRYLTISDAEFILLDSNNHPIASLSGVAFHGRRNADGGWNGVVQATQAAVGNSLILHELHSPITLSPQGTTLSLNEFAAVCGGGKLGGTFSLDLPPSSPRYTLSMNLEGASLNQFLTDASIENSSAAGAISGNLQLSGITGSGATMEGQGNILFTDATIQPVDCLKQIGQLLQIDELQLLRLSEGRTHFQIHDGGVVLDTLTLRSENLILLAQGPVRFNGDLDLQARLLFNEKLTSRIRGFLGPQLGQAPEPGYSQVAFHVSGSMKNPQTDLLERLTGIRIGGDLGGLLQGFFGHRTPSSPPPQNPVAPTH